MKTKIGDKINAFYQTDCHICGNKNATAEWYEWGSSITHAFEVATTVETANKAINDRIRNLFVASPNLLIKAYVVVKDKDFDKAHKTLFSKANKKDGITDKVKIVRLGELVAENLDKLLAM